MTFRFLLFLLVCVCTLPLITGCSTIIDAHSQKKEIMTAYLRGDRQRTESELTDKLQSTKGTGDELMWQLEASGFYFGGGRFPFALRHLTKAQELIDGYDDRAKISIRDAGEEVGSATVNLNVLPYKGFCRDRVMIPLYKALAMLGEKNEDGFFVELNALRSAQDKVVEYYNAEIEREKEEIKKEKSDVKEDDILKNEEFKEITKEQDAAALRGYGNFLNPFAVYLSGIGFLRKNDTENALVDFKRLYDAMPSNPWVQQYYVTVLKKARRSIPPALQKVKPFAHHSSESCIYIVFAPGRTAAFRQVKINLIYTGFAFPVCEYYPSDFRKLSVSGGGLTVKTVSIADMDAIFSQEHKARLPLQIVRMVISYAVKEAAATAANVAAYNADPLAGIITIIGTSTYKYLFNTADTRCWEMLPKEFQVAELPMPSDRKLQITAESSLPNLAAAPRSISLPEGCRSAIVYVDAPSGNTLQIHIFPFFSK